jgi:hypothetical protein
MTGYLLQCTWAAMASMVLLRMSPFWSLPQSRLIEHPLPATLARDAIAGFPHCWLCLAGLDLPRFECRSQVLDLEHLLINPDTHYNKNNTNCTEIIFTAVHDFTSELKPGIQVSLARWLRITLYGTKTKGHFQWSFFISGRDCLGLLWLMQGIEHVKQK